MNLRYRNERAMAAAAAAAGPAATGAAGAGQQSMAAAQLPSWVSPWLGVHACDRPFQVLQACVACVLPSENVHGTALLHCDQTPHDANSIYIDECGDVSSVSHKPHHAC
jgi:hypothetical protein